MQIIGIAYLWQGEIINESNLIQVKVENDKMKANSVEVIFN